MSGMVADEASAPPVVVDPEQSLPELYREHRLALVRLGVLLLGDQAAAEDIVQDVFASLWRRRAVPDRPLCYLQRAVVNGCRGRIRRIMLARRKPPPVDRDGPTPVELVVLAEEHRAVLAALDRLPRRQREVLVLRYYSGLTIAAAAEAMGINEGTVKSTAARGLLALRHLLEEVKA